MKNNKHVESFGQFNENLNSKTLEDTSSSISDVIVSNKIILRGNFKAEIVDGNIHIVFDKDYDRIYVDTGKLFNEFCNLQFWEDDNGVINEISVEDNYGRHFHIN